MSNPSTNPYQQPQPGPQPGKTPRRFFTWVRASGLVRGDDRWIGGVCSGIALRLGWSPTLVRALVIVSTLFFGFGAALYALGWFLMPDMRGGRILAEDLIAGQWDWNCLGCFLFLAVAIVIPGAGWACIALAALALWLLAKSGIRQQEGYGFGCHGGRPGTGGPRPMGPAGPAGMGGGNPGPGPNLNPYGPYGSYGPNPAGPGGYAPNGYVPNGYGPAPTGYAAPQNGPNPGAMNGNGPAAPNPFSPNPAAAAPNPMATAANPAGPDSPAAEPNPFMPDGSATAQPSVSRPVSQSSPYVSRPVSQAGYRRTDGLGSQDSGSSSPVPPVLHRSTRRKPAGPIVVLSVLGLMFLSFAAVMAMIWEYDMDITTIMRVGTIWIAAVCVVMGLIVMALGIRGRRAGGLIPLGLLAGTCAVVMIVTCGTYSIRYSDAVYANANYADITLTEQYASEGSYDMNEIQANGVFYADSSAQTFKRLEHGIWFSGDNYDSRRAVLDLSDWENTHEPHQLELESGNKTMSNCPAGTITVSAVQSQITVILPDACSYGMGNGQYGYMYANSIGGKYSVVYDATDIIGFFDTDRGFSFDATDHNYDWLNNNAAIPANGPELLINIPYAAAAKVNVVYASEWKGDTFRQFANKHSRNPEQYASQHNDD